MLLAADILTAIIALLHLYFMVLEMFLWEKPQGLKVFHLSPEKAAVTKALAQNQGLYNGFLAAGLIWGLVPTNYSDDVKIFFLSCVVIAGIYGALTVNRRIVFIQGAPAALGLVLVLLS